MTVPHLPRKMSIRHDFKNTTQHFDNPKLSSTCSMLDCKNYCSTLWEYEPTCRHFPFFLNKYIQNNAFSQPLLADSANIFQKIQVGASATPLGVIAAPAAVLCGIFGATLLGAVSYRRSARRMAQALEVGSLKSLQIRLLGKNDEFYYVLLVRPHCRQRRRHPHLCPLCPLLQRATQVRLDLFEHREQVTFWQRGRSCTCS